MGGHRIVPIERARTIRNRRAQDKVRLLETVTDSETSLPVLPLTRHSLILAAVVAGLVAGSLIAAILLMVQYLGVAETVTAIGEQASLP